MPLRMIHPYYGHWVECAECDGTQHDRKHAVAVAYWEFCEDCGVSYECCRICEVVIGCCACTLHHAEECPWPL